MPKFQLVFAMKKYYLISLIVIILDQLTKSWASAALSDGTVIPVLSFLDFHLAHNYGAAFSMLSDAGGWQRWFFIVFSLLVSIILVVWILRLTPQERWVAIALALILGGGIGNLIDRVNLGYVVDFISVHYRHYAFPTFNIADSAISIGAFMLILDMLYYEPRRQKALSLDTATSSHEN